MIYTINNNGFIAEFINLDEAKEYALNNGNLVVEGEITSYKKQFYLDKEFGQKMSNMFLIDNRELARPFTPQESFALLTKFQGIEALFRLGDIKTAYYAMQGIVIDTIFTQERKNKYINEIKNYLKL